jgi:hypothetical protein
MENVRVPIRQIITTAIAAGAGALSAYLVVEALTGVVGLVAGLLVGIVLFVAVGSALKIIRHDDADWLVGSTSGTRAAGPVGLLCRLFSTRPSGAA